MNKIVSLADNSNVYDVAKVTPLSIAVQISERFGNQVYLKREDEQSIHSFKLRGAYQKMSSLSDAQKIKGVELLQLETTLRVLPWRQKN